MVDISLQCKRTFPTPTFVVLKSRKGEGETKKEKENKFIYLLLWSGSKIIIKTTFIVFVIYLINPVISSKHTMICVKMSNFSKSKKNYYNDQKNTQCSKIKFSMNLPKKYM